MKTKTINVTETIKAVEVNGFDLKGYKKWCKENKKNPDNKTSFMEYGSKFDKTIKECWEKYVNGEITLDQVEIMAPNFDEEDEDKVENKSAKKQKAKELTDEEKRQIRITKRLLWAMDEFCCKEGKSVLKDINVKESFEDNDWLALYEAMSNTFGKDIAKIFAKIASGMRLIKELFH